MRLQMQSIALSSVLMILAIFGIAQAQRNEPGVRIIGNSTVTSQLEAPGAKVRITGRASIHLEASESLLKQGAVQVKGFNLAYFEVPQQPLAGNIKVERQTGVLGFAANPRAQPRLKYDARSGTLQGNIQGSVDATYMANLLPKEKRDDNSDLFNTVTQPAVLTIEIRLARPFEASSQDIRHERVELSLTLRTRAIKFEDFQIPTYAVTILEPLVFEWQIAHWILFRAARQLCIQPVRIGQIRVTSLNPPNLSASLTGAGLAFGQPGANAEWEKADVVFDYRNWKTLWKPGYFVVDTNPDFTTSTEQASLLSEVDDSDCIEVYFIDAFDPESWGGGGATWGSGTAGAKIITSDVNADGGIDFNHLAHEFGHVLGLLHPSNAPNSNAVPASTGTLMCPSGFLNDNPGINSQANENNLSNPLLTFVFAPISKAPDCLNSADCGACP